MWFGVGDDMLAPLAIPPVQFHDIARSKAVSPECGLALAVIAQAINDLITHRCAHRRRQQRAYWEAYEWMVADDHEWPFSFVNLCARPPGGGAQCGVDGTILRHASIEGAAHLQAVVSSAA
jgi:hypothetical protein